MPKKKQPQLGKKAGSIISNPVDPPASNKSKAKKPKKQSKGKQK